MLIPGGETDFRGCLVLFRVNCIERERCIRSDTKKRSSKRTEMNRVSLSITTCDNQERTEGEAGQRPFSLKRCGAHWLLESTYIYKKLVKYYSWLLTHMTACNKINYYLGNCKCS